MQKISEDYTGTGVAGRSFRQTGGFWRAYSAAQNLVRCLLFRPGTLWRKPRNPWEWLEDDRQFEELLKRYPVQPIATDGIVIGLLKGFDQTWRNYAKAFQELNVSYEEIDLTRPDWLHAIRNSRCDGFIAHPQPYSEPWRALFEERLFVIGRDLQKPLHPGLPELWLHESKRRMAYWLAAHNVPHPVTRVYYDREQAFAFAAGADYPLVCKTDLGSGADGVFLLTRPGQAYRLIAKAFGGGLLGRSRDPRDREWGTILFQQFIPQAREFRVIQIGDSWFAHEKCPDDRTGKHSGSGRVVWTVPPDHVFDFCRSIAERGRFRAMNYDVFMDREGRCLINELQAVFAAYNPSQMYRDGIPGRMMYDGSAWQFEEGLFCRNGCANLRVEELVNRLRATSGERTGSDGGNET